MVDEYVDPVDSVKPSHHIESRSGARPEARQHHASLSGYIVAVRRQSGHREGEHVLDTSVGAEEHTEIVVRVDSGEFDDLVGKRVVVNFKP